MKTDYNEIFDQDADFEFFFNKPGYGPVLVAGVVSLKNALSRMKKNEYYALVTYKEGEILPEEYKEIDTDDSLDIRFATISNKAHYYNISINGGIQRISELPGNRLLLGPGPETISLPDLVNGLYDDYVQNMNSKMSIR